MHSNFCGNDQLCFVISNLQMSDKEEQVQKESPTATDETTPVKEETKETKQEETKKEEETKTGTGLMSVVRGSCVARVHCAWFFSSSSFLPLSFSSFPSHLLCLSSQCFIDCWFLFSFFCTVFSLLWPPICPDFVWWPWRTPTCTRTHARTFNQSSLLLLSLSPAH